MDSTSISVAALEPVASFAGRTFWIQDGGALYLGNGASFWRYGNVQVDGILDLGAGGSFYWRAGNFDGDGAVYVAGANSRLNAQTNAGTLSVDITIGRNSDGSVTSGGDFWISSPNEFTQLAGNLTVQNATIIVSNEGYLQFMNTINSNTRGGIHVPQGSTGSIYVASGTVRRVRDTTNQTLTIKAPLTMDGGVLMFDAEARAEWNDTAGSSIFLESPAKIEMFKGAYLKTANGIIVDGASIIVKSDATTRATAEIEGNLDLIGAGSVIDIGDGQQLATLLVTGNLTARFGTLKFTVDAAGADRDLLSVSGTFSLQPTAGDSVTLDVTTINGAPMAGQIFEIITFGQRQGANDFAAFNFVNFNFPNHGFVGTAYRLTA